MAHLLKCALCPGNAEEKDYCYGCQAYICLQHDHFPFALPKSHRPEDHLILREAFLKYNEAVKDIEAIIKEKI